MTPRATAGSLFDPAARPLYFSAGRNDAKHYPHHVLLAANECMTRHGENHLVATLDAGHAVLLDSGVFWLTQQHMRATGCTMADALALAPEDIDGWDELYTRYVYLTKTYGDRLWGYIELDQGGADNKRRTRDRLHAEGLAPMPVYHPLNDGWDYFDELASTYDRICLGGVAQITQAMRVRILHTLWERRRQYPNLWVHVLGVRVSEWCLPFAIDSCDSSTWLRGVRYPNVETEVAGLRRLGDLGPRFLYDPLVTAGPGASRANATRVYADTVEHHNDLWRIALDDLARLGAEPYPARHDAEGELRPPE